MEKVLSFAHNLLKQKLNSESVVIDATVGKGNDTFFLADFVKKVYAFDIQSDAILITKEKCKDFNNIEYILDSHENILNYVEAGSLDGVIFNLGYMPSKDHLVTTKVNSTIKAIKASMEALRVGGIIVIVVYPGHSEGYKESIEINNFLSNVDQKKWDVINYSFINQINNPPYLIALERLK